MNKWLTQFLEKPDISDKPDRFEHNTNMSVLSVRPQDILCKNLENISETGPDISDKFGSNMDMSDLSGSPQRLLEKNLGNMLRMISDKSDNNTLKPDLSLPFRNTFDKDSLRYDFQERLAAVEHDGHQTATQAHQVAYLDAFISILSSLTEEELHKDWLAERIQIALATLETQRFSTLN